MRMMHDGYTILLDEFNLMRLKEELSHKVSKNIAMPINCMIKNEHYMFDGIIISLNMLSQCAIIKTGESLLWAIPLIHNIAIYENKSSMVNIVGGLSSDSAKHFCE